MLEDAETPGVRKVALRISIVLGPGNAVRRQLGVPAGVPTPAWLLDLGGRIILTEPELVLRSRGVSSRKLFDA